MLQSKSNSFSPPQQGKEIFMNQSDVHFALNVLFPVFLASYEAQIQNAQSSILKMTSGKQMNFANIRKFSDTQKKDFLSEFLLIHGNKDSVILNGFETRLFTQRQFIRRSITLQFADEKEAARYIAFRNTLVGLEVQKTSEVA